MSIFQEIAASVRATLADIDTARTQAHATITKLEQAAHIFRTAVGESRSPYYRRTLELNARFRQAARRRGHFPTE